MKVEKTSERTWRVESENEPGTYYVVWFDPLRNAWKCTCPSHRFRNRICKHILAVLKEVEKWRK